MPDRCTHWYPLLAAWALAASTACTPAPLPAGAAGAGLADSSSTRQGQSDAATGLPEPLDLSLDASAVDAALGGPPYAAAVRAQGPWLGRLLVVLPEAGQTPAAYRELMRVAARGGLHAVAVPRALDPPLTSMCGNDPDCYGPARGELIDGIDRSPKLTVSLKDSLVFRLGQGLQGLATAFPSHNWGQFVQGNQPVWSKVVVAGHGDGAGQAAYIAKQLQVARVVLLAGPVDGSSTTPPAWATSQHATPVAGWQGFGHTADPLWPRTAATWTAMGLGAGGPSWPSTDEGTILGAVAMTTSLAAAAPALSVATDADTPRDADGKPRYRATWRVLVGGAPF